MTREEHLTWCKARALEYLPTDPQQAVGSMLSDLRKHKDFGADVYNMLGMLGIMSISQGSEAVRKWINGFN